MVEDELEKMKYIEEVTEIIFKRIEKMTERELDIYTSNLKTLSIDKMDKEEFELYKSLIAHCRNKSLKQIASAHCRNKSLKQLQRREGGYPISLLNPLGANPKSFEADYWELL